MDGVLFHQSVTGNKFNIKLVIKCLLDKLIFSHRNVLPKEMKESMNTRTPHSFGTLDYSISVVVLVITTLTGLPSIPLGPT